VFQRLLGVFLIAGLALGAAGQDKSKKAYELIYEDVQVLKERVQDLRARLEQNAEDIRAIKDQLKALADLVRQSISDQAALKEGVSAVPAQYQDMLRKIDQLSLDLQRVSAALAAAREAAAAPAGSGEGAGGKPAAEAAPQKKPGKNATPPSGPVQNPVQPATVPPPPATNISPEEAYRMAYGDYLKGNYDLARESFKLYRQQFPDSPLADNALYWIGECYFSQKKYEEAIDTFNNLILTYPRGDKAAAAYLKKGISLMDLGKKDEALAVFKILVTKYPLQDETRIAQDKIKELTGK
jgi:tol-pal system protein YbgF